MLKKLTVFLFAIILLKLFGCFQGDCTLCIDTRNCRKVGPVIESPRLEIMYKEGELDDDFFRPHIIQKLQDTSLDTSILKFQYMGFEVDHIQNYKEDSLGNTTKTTSHLRISYHVSYKWKNYPIRNNIYVIDSSFDVKNSQTTFTTHFDSARSYTSMGPYDDKKWGVEYYMKNVKVHYQTVDSLIKDNRIYADSNQLEWTQHTTYKITLEVDGKEYSGYLGFNPYIYRYRNTECD